MDLLLIINETSHIKCTLKIMTDLYFTLHKICANTGEYGSVKTRILAYFMQCYKTKNKNKNRFEKVVYSVLVVKLYWQNIKKFF